LARHDRPGQTPRRIGVRTEDIAGFEYLPRTHHPPPRKEPQLAAQGQQCANPFQARRKENFDDRVGQQRPGKRLGKGKALGRKEC
jgi:hypothetical protein